MSVKQKVKAKPSGAIPLPKSNNPGIEAMNTAVLEAAKEAGLPIAESGEQAQVLSVASMSDEEFADKVLNANGNTQEGEFEVLRGHTHQQEFYNAEPLASFPGEESGQTAPAKGLGEIPEAIAARGASDAEFNIEALNARASEIEAQSGVVLLDIKVAYARTKEIEKYTVPGEQVMIDLDRLSDELFPEYLQSFKDALLKGSGLTIQEYHEKYASLGGHGVLTGKESKEVIEKEALIMEEMTAWVNLHKSKVKKNS